MFTPCTRLLSALPTACADCQAAGGDGAPGRVPSRTCKEQEHVRLCGAHEAEPELADKEAAEILVLQVYLPQRMSADEVLAEVRAIVAEMGAKGPGDMGKVMGIVKTRLAGKAEMGTVSAAVKAALAS